MVYGIWYMVYGIWYMVHTTTVLLVLLTVHVIISILQTMCSLGLHLLFPLLLLLSVINTLCTSVNTTTTASSSSVQYQHQYRALTTSQYWTLLTNYTTSHLKHLAKQHIHYLQRQPFPHAVIDHIFPHEILQAIVTEIPDHPIHHDGCIEGSRCHQDYRQKGKNAFDSDEYFGPATATMFAYLKSSTFIKFLEHLTGIKDIIPDPHYRGSGIHQTISGGFLNIHADFNRYERYELHRRVNILLYLNPDWKEEYGGHLELWSKDMNSCMVRSLPVLGRMTIFSSTDFSYHGHPEPLTAPEDRSRRSLAMYYYTRTRPKEECIKGNCFNTHTTLFQTPKCGKSCLDKGCNKLITNQA